MKQLFLEYAAPLVPRRLTSTGWGERGNMVLKWPVREKLCSSCSK
jgi:hypothetical protein